MRSPQQHVGRSSAAASSEMCRAHGEASSLQLVALRQVTYDPAEATYEQLLQAFTDGHDPTQLNRQVCFLL